MASIPIVGGIGNDSLVISIFPSTVFDASGAPVVAEDGSQFNFRFNVLPGDENGSGQVNSTDAFNVFASNTFATTEAIARRDIDGSSQINSTDAFASFANNTNGLPAPPTAPTPPAAAISLPISVSAIDEVFSVASFVEEPVVEVPFIEQTATEESVSELVPVISAISQPVAALVQLDNPQTATSPVANRYVRTSSSEIRVLNSSPDLALAGHVETEEVEADQWADFGEFETFDDVDSFELDSSFREDGF